MTATGAERLRVQADTGGFDTADVEQCDEPVRRYFQAAIAPRTPLARAARLRMRGSIKLANHWVPFRADELLAPLHGYHWPATVAGGLLRGSDDYVDGQATMRWKLLGLVPLIRASGPDMARSAIGRATAEGIWLPTALLPRYGVTWHAEDDEHLVAQLRVAGEHVTLHVSVDADGQVVSGHVDRWSDPDGSGAFGWCPFGVEATATRTFPCGITLPAEGTGGWFHGTERWPAGEFMRYSIDELTLI